MKLAELIKSRLTEKTGYLNQIIFEVLKTIILKIELPANYKLPSSRKLAADLNVSRNTIMLVYEQLLLEGYVYTSTGAGTFIKEGINNKTIKVPDAHISLSNRGNSLLKNTYSDISRMETPFSPFSPDVSLFPHKSFNNIINTTRKKIDNASLHYTTDAGDKELKKAIADHLEQSRAIKCEPNQILLFTSTNESLTLLSNILCDPSDHIIMENPTYWGFQTIFQLAGLQVQNVNVDDQGIRVEELIKETRHSPKMIMVMPSRQYPLGYVLSVDRRLKLLEYAKKHQAWIIEDDYDSEFSLSKYSISSLYSFSPNTNVIYSGSFSKSIYPSIQVSYLVVPASIRDALVKAHGVLYRNSNRVRQRALATFINKGDYANHLKFVKNVYFKRRQWLLNLLQKFLGNNFIEATSYLNTGLHINLYFPDHWDDITIVNLLAENGISSSALSNYYAKPPVKKGLLLGFANIEENKMDEPVKKLAQIIKKYELDLTSKLF